ncbi:MAG: hypothetical protein LBG19_12315 [Prevotellaceae bacterium]|nr:hypothetical protein [Prevotellaceae bacterium]
MPEIKISQSTVINKNHHLRTQQKPNTELPFFSSVAIDKFEIIDGRIYYNSADTTAYNIGNFMLSLSDIKVDSAINIINPLIHVNNAMLEVNKIRHFLPDSVPLFQIRKLSANLKDSLLYVDSLTVFP